MNIIREWVCSLADSIGQQGNVRVWHGIVLRY